MVERQSFIIITIFLFLFFRYKKYISVFIQTTGSRICVSSERDGTLRTPPRHWEEEETRIRTRILAPETNVFTTQPQIPILPQSQQRRGPGSQWARLVVLLVLAIDRNVTKDCIYWLSIATRAALAKYTRTCWSFLLWLSDLHCESPIANGSGGGGG